MIKKAFSFTLYLLFFGISLLPFWALYLISDGLSFILQKLVKYRKRVIEHNLKTCFPEKSKSELEQIRNQVYRNLADLIVESIKMITLSRKTLQSRYKLINPEIFNDSKYQKGSLACWAHFNNWEWGALALATLSNTTVIGLYKPINNISVEKMIFKIRSRFGSILTPKKKWLRTVVAHKAEKTLSLFIGDQKPAAGEKGNSLIFLGRETPVIIGFEKAAKITEFEVIYIQCKKVKRGFYEINFIPMNDKPDLENLTLTKKYFSLLEADIINNPSGWLWSHNRWNIKK
ncbi:MAG: KDO2-lipid IV(A) lauroyltransferase [Sphingobacteriales bacterium]|jgi:KDO2-lipid IV(A) lauroyltransferase